MDSVVVVVEAVVLTAVVAFGVAVVAMLHTRPLSLAPRPGSDGLVGMNAKCECKKQNQKANAKQIVGVLAMELGATDMYNNRCVIIIADRKQRRLDLK